MNLGDLIHFKSDAKLWLIMTIKDESLEVIDTCKIISMVYLSHNDDFITFLACMSNGECVAALTHRSWFENDGD